MLDELPNFSNAKSATRFHYSWFSSHFGPQSPSVTANLHRPWHILATINQNLVSWNTTKNRTEVGRSSTFFLIRDNRETLMKRVPARVLRLSAKLARWGKKACTSIDFIGKSRGRRRTSSSMDGALAWRRETTKSSKGWKILGLKYSTRHQAKAAHYVEHPWIEPLHPPPCQLSSCFCRAALAFHAT